MKKPIVLSLALCMCLYAQESIFNKDTTEQQAPTENVAQEEKNQTQPKKNLPKYDELIEFKANEEDLDYLLKDSNTKFPVDDYIWRGGKKKPTQDVSQIFKDLNANNKSMEDIEKEEQEKFRRQIQQELMERKGANKGNIILDENGNPKLDANGNPMYDNIMYDEFGRPILDANGNPRYKNVVYDKDGNPIYDKNGNLVLKQDMKDVKDKGNIMLDKNGKPMLDANGNPMYDNVMYDENGNPMYDEKGNLLLKNDPKKGKILLDANGKPILDANGNPRYENVLYDENGNPMYDENGNLILKNDPVKGKILLDKNGNPILDANGNPRYSNVMYDANGNPIYDANGNLLLKTDPKAKALEEAQRQAEELRKQLEAMKNAQNDPNNPNSPNYRGGNGNYSGGGVAYIGGRSINSIMRDSVLAERGSTDIHFSKPDSKYGVDAFSNQKNVDSATNEHRLYRTILAGSMIPVILTTAISSEVEGIVTAQVEQDIYASMGRVVLIPRGTKVLGFYKNDNKIGQNRLAIDWREMITPQGVNILLTNAIVADNIGMNGAPGSVNNKYLERYGIGYSLSTVSNILLLSLANQSGGNPYSEQLYKQTNQDVSSIVEDIIEQQKEVKPVIEIKQGSRMYIRPTTHIWFPKPRNNEVMAVFFQDEENEERMKNERK